MTIFDNFYQKYIDFSFLNATFFCKLLVFLGYLPCKKSSHVFIFQNNLVWANTSCSLIWWRKTLWIFIDFSLNKDGKAHLVSLFQTFGNSSCKILTRFLGRRKIQNSNKNQFRFVYKSSVAKCYFRCSSANFCECDEMTLIFYWLSYIKEKCDWTKWLTGPLYYF